MKISGASTSQDPPFVVSASTTFINCGTVSDAGSEVNSHENNSDANSEIDESELGEFLMDTFDAMDASALIDVPRMAI